MFNLPSVPDLFEFDGLNFYEDYSSVAWTLCTNWVESWKDVLEYENKICFYDECFLLFDESTGDVSCACSSISVCVPAYGAASFSGPVSCSCSASVAYRSSYGVATYFSCPVTTDLVRYRVWDQ